MSASKGPRVAAGYWAGTALRLGRAWTLGGRRPTGTAGGVGFKSRPPPSSPFPSRRHAIRNGPLDDDATCLTRLRPTSESPLAFSDNQPITNCAVNFYESLSTRRPLHILGSWPASVARDSGESEPGLQRDLFRPHHSLSGSIIPQQFCLSVHARSNLTGSLRHRGNVGGLFCESTYEEEPGSSCEGLQSLGS